MTVFEALKDDAIGRLTNEYLNLALDSAPYEKAGKRVPPLLYWRKGAMSNMVYLLKCQPLEEFVPQLRNIINVHYTGDKATKAAVNEYKKELAIWESVIVS